MTVGPSIGIIVTVAEPLIGDIGNVREWCDLWGMELNVTKKNHMIVSRSSTMHPRSSPLTIDLMTLTIDLKGSDDIVVLGVTFDLKMTFETHLRSVSRAAS